MPGLAALQLGQVVFLVGSGTALGSWDMYHGIILETSLRPS